MVSGFILKGMVNNFHVLYWTIDQVLRFFFFYWRTVSHTLYSFLLVNRQLNIHLKGICTCGEGFSMFIYSPANWLHTNSFFGTYIFLRDTLATLCLETVPASLKVLILLWNILITFNYAYIIYLSFKSLSLISRVPLPVTAWA